MGLYAKIYGLYIRSNDVVLFFLNMRGLVDDPYTILGVRSENMEFLVDVLVNEELALSPPGVSLVLRAPMDLCVSGSFVK